VPSLSRISCGLQVDIGAHQDAVLQLSSVNLPGGAQRKRTSQDQLEMRTLFIENDLISAEVQQVNSSDGAVALHTRSLRYGKLENGRLVCVPQSRVRRLKQHFVTLDEIGVDILLGTNGWIWVTRTSGKASDGEVSTR
jgi:exosome complex component RRP4